MKIVGKVINLYYLRGPIEKIVCTPVADSLFDNTLIYPLNANKQMNLTLVLEKESNI